LTFFNSQVHFNGKRNSCMQISLCTACNY
jgi:hypothetical protein